ncbi:uncharacterized protein YALI1_A04990g [Yarrowia lipolytica]|uniref:Uncharacterized protein n=1 Tax=Yarrowia lipolytica TaxID=4952 RepID=A0A1D8N3S1_YARLL|nr:hypothetical protein YALI1_A04990g [Yarrowia lipolytica]
MIKRRMKATKDEMLDLNKPTPTKPSGSERSSDNGFDHFGSGFKKMIRFELMLWEPVQLSRSYVEICAEPVSAASGGEV